MCGKNHLLFLSLSSGGVMRKAVTRALQSTEAQGSKRNLSSRRRHQSGFRHVTASLFSHKRPIRFFSTMSSVPPVPEKISHAIDFHELKWDDPFFWLREKTNEKVISHLNAENDYTEAMMAHTKDLQAQLYKELVGRIKETDTSAPYPYGPYIYYRRTEEGQQYPIFCRKLKGDGSVEEIILDQNKEAAGKPYFRIGVQSISPNHEILAYSVDEAGDEKYTLFFKNLKTGQLLPDRIKDTEYSFEWANDNKTVFYMTVDDTHRPYRLYKHVLGSSADDQLVLEETDMAFYSNLGKSRDDKFIFLNSSSNVTSEVKYLDANKPDSDWKLVYPRKQNVEYDVDHQDGKFYIKTNENAVNFKLLSVPVSELSTESKSNWTEVIPHRGDVHLLGVEPFKNHLVIMEREGGLKTIRVQDNRTGVIEKIAFSEPVYAAYGSVNMEYDTNIFRYQYASLTTPNSVYDYNMNDKSAVLIKQEEVQGGYDQSEYASQREWAVSADGARVPVSVVYKKSLFKQDGTNPLLLYGYGSYGYSMDPSFSSARLPLLDRGFVYAIAHIRGGSELGRPWYEDGKLLKKKNTFQDFVAAGRYLHEKKYSSPEKTAIQGGSAGGLLMGAVINLAPDVARAVIAQVPFVDCLNTMMDPTLPLTVTEYEEWGNPNNKEYFDYIKSYAPYENIEKKAYPAILALGGLNDPRVSYWEPAKWVAKLRELKTDSNVIMLKTKMDQGHGGASGRYDYLKEIAINWAFAIDQLKVKY